MDEDGYILLSALQHYAFCPRQCALIHIEQTFEENLYTLRGQRVHQRVDAGDYELREGIRMERALPLWSHQLRLRGVADVVELGADGTPFPIEYKSGTRKQRAADEIQLCAQALCLEEMLGHSIPAGAIFYHGSRRRQDVYFTPELRARVLTIVDATRQMLTAGKLPQPVTDSRCTDCSLVEICLPYAVRDFARVRCSLDPFVLEEEL